MKYLRHTVESMRLTPMEIRLYFKMMKKPRQQRYYERNHGRDV